MRVGFRFFRVKGVLFGLVCSLLRARGDVGLWLFYACFLCALGRIGNWFHISGLLTSSTS